MTRFAGAGHFVRWVESRYLRWLVGRRADFLRARRERPAPGLEVRPVTLINGERLGFIRAHNQYWLGRALRAGLPRGAAGPRVLWLYNPHEAHLAERVPHDLLVYDMMDEYSGFPWSPPGIAQEEYGLLRRADWVFAGTRALYEAKRHAAEGRIECVLSGVETELFAHPAANPEVARQLRELRAGYRKLAGYAGMIDLRIDQDLLLQAARHFPEWGFVLVGPVATDVTPLLAAPNIHLVGQQPYESLPAWYHGWDAALLPFVENELTRHINPTKMLEYAAAGVPVVARALPDVRACYADGAWLYGTPIEFILHLENLDHSSSAPAIAEKLALARAWAAERSWETLSNRMLARLQALIDVKRQKSNVQ